MNLAGKNLVFDYGDFVVNVRYLGDGRLRWEQLKGPEPGSSAEESFQSLTVRPGVFFLSWKERDASILVQVVDLELRRVHTTWISPDGNISQFQGAITTPA